MPFRDSFLVVGGGQLQLPMINKLKNAGIRVIVTDGNPDAPGLKIADLGLVVDTYDEDAHAYIGKQNAYELAGVATCGADVAPSVSAAAKECWDIPHLPYHIAKRTHSKYEVRKALHEAGLDEFQPKWACIQRKSKAGKFTKVYGTKISKLTKEAYVTKPLSKSASRGVLLCEPHSDIHKNASESLSEATSGLVMLEERLHGVEFSAETILCGGKDIYFNIVDRSFVYFNGRAIEVGHTNPSCGLSGGKWELMRRIVLDAAEALGVAWGPFKCDLMSNQDGMFILECTARLSGGYDCQATTPLSTGRDPIAAVLSLSCGETPDPKTVKMPGKFKYAVCHAILPPPGFIKEDCQDELDSIFNTPLGKTVQRVYWSDKIKPGAFVNTYDNCAERSGFVISASDLSSTSWAFADAHAKTLANKIKTLMYEEKMEKDARAS